MAISRRNHAVLYVRDAERSAAHACAPAASEAPPAKTAPEAPPAEAAPDTPPAEAAPNAPPAAASLS